MSLSFTLGAYIAFALLLLGFFSQAVKLAQNSASLADAYQIRTALDMYDTEHGAYPTELSQLVPDYLTIPTGVDLKTFDYSQTAGGATYSLAVSGQ